MAKCKAITNWWWKG